MAGFESKVTTAFIPSYVNVTENLQVYRDKPTPLRMWNEYSWVNGMRRQ